MLKPLLDRLFFRSKSFRRFLASIYQVDGQSPDLSHLAIFPEGESLGPLQREEALLLFGMCRVLRPAVIVEFGFLRGFSALNFLQAMPADSFLASYDVSEASEEIARSLFDVWPNFRFFRKSQIDFDPADLEHRLIDLCLIDASHDFELNVQTFDKVYRSLAPSGLVFIHDTGVWSKKCLGSDHKACIAHADPGFWLTEDLYVPRPEEVRFVNHLADHFPDLSVLHLHSKSTLRHGLTVFQRSNRIPICSRLRTSTAQTDNIRNFETELSENNSALKTRIR
jgi:Methyltransferase domain